MLRPFHTVSAALFYLLGWSFVACFLLVRNDMGGQLARLWLVIGDLPLLATGMLYGGLSVYESLHEKPPHSMPLILIIGIPSALLFLLFLVLNFWGAF